MFLFFFIDGDKDKEDIRRGIIGTNDAGGRQKLLRTIWSGEYCISNVQHYYIALYRRTNNKTVKFGGLYFNKIANVARKRNG